MRTLFYYALAAVSLFQSMPLARAQVRLVDSRGAVESQTASAPLKNGYALSVAGMGTNQLVAGRSMEDTPVVILRPSPGDDYWYRLPHSIEVRGPLPEGVQFVQKGASFHQLARFSGTPKTPGVYPVTLQATMADGIKTSELSVLLTVTDPSDVSNVLLFPYGRNRFEVGETVKEWFLSAYAPSSPRGLPLGSASSLKVTGLPPGLVLAPVVSGERADAVESGAFEIVGTPSETGSFFVAFEWLSSASSVVGRAERQIEVIPAGLPQAKTLKLNPGAGNRPLRQFEQIAPGTPGVPTMHISDNLTRPVESGFRLVVEGLPKGLSVAAEPSAFSFLEGASQQAGTFSIRLKAVFDGGGETEWESMELRIEASGWWSNRAAAAGIYDCLIDRSEELNRNNGGRLFVTLTPSGAVSGYIINGFNRFAFASKDVSVEAQSGSISIRPPGAKVVFEGTIQEDDQGYSTPNRKLFVLSGNLRTAEGTGTASIRGMQAIVRTGASRSPYGSSLPVNLMVMKGDIFSMAGEVGDAPAGISFMSLRIASSGIVTATVWPADGSAPSSTSTRLSETEASGARFSLHFPLSNSSGRNSMLAQLFVNLDGDAAGQLSWFQNAADRGIFPEGIPLIEYGGLIGSRDVPTKAGLNLEGFEQGVANAEMELLRAEGELDAAEVLTVGESAISLARRPVATPPTGAAAAAAGTLPAMSGMSMRYDPRSGMLTGGARLRPQAGGATRTVTFRGIRAPGGEFIAGHYLLSGVGKDVPAVTGQLKIMPSRPPR
jgi:hypothetical protein